MLIFLMLFIFLLMIFTVFYYTYAISASAYKFNSKKMGKHCDEKTDLNEDPDLEQIE